MELCITDCVTSENAASVRQKKAHLLPAVGIRALGDEVRSVLTYL